MASRRNEIARRRGRKIKLGKNKLNGDIRQGEHHWSHTLILVGLFIGGVLVLVLANYTVVTTIDLLRLYVLCGAGALILPYRFYRKKLKLEVWELVLGSLLGVGPLLMGILMSMNFLFAGPDETQTFQVVHIEQTKRSFLSKFDVKLHLEGSAFEEYPELRSFDVYQTPEASVANSVTYRTANGLFGHKVIKEVKFN